MAFEFKVLKAIAPYILLFSIIPVVLLWGRPLWIFAMIAAGAGVMGFVAAPYVAKDEMNKMFEIDENEAVDYEQ